MATDSLYRIIKSMSTGEKIHFKRSMNKKSEKKTPSYLILFDIIDGIEEYDKVAIEKKLKAKKIKFNYNETKNYLQEVLVEFIEAYNSEKGLYLKTSRLLRISKILYDKNLYPEANDYLEKAKDIANENQMYEMLLHINTNEINLGWQSKTENRFNMLQEKWTEKENTIGAINNIFHHMKAFDLIRFIHTEDPSSRDEEMILQASEIINSLKKIPQTKLFYPKLLQLWVSALYNRLTQNYPEMKAQYGEMLELFHAFPQMKKRFNSDYYNILEFCFTISCSNNNYAHFNKLYHEYVNSLKILDIHFQAFPPLFIKTIKLGVLINRGEISTALKNIQVEDLSQFDDKKNIYLLMKQFSLIHQYAYIYLLNKDYRLAFQSTIFILNHFNLKSQTNIHIYYAAKILRLIITFESGEGIIHESMLQSTQKYFFRHQQLHELETIIFRLFNVLLKNRKNNSIWNETKNEIEKFDPYFLHEYLAFDILSWLDSKIQKRDMVDIMKEKAEKNYPEIFELEIENI